MVIGDFYNWGKVPETEGAGQQGAELGAGERLWEAPGFRLTIHHMLVTLHSVGGALPRVDPELRPGGLPPTACAVVSRGCGDAA